MSHPVHPDHAAGALVGMALGDAIGLLVAGQSPRYCKDYAKTSLASDEPPWLTREKLTFGQYGIDTQLARELAYSLVAARGFDPIDYAERLKQLVLSEYAIEPGKATLASAKRLAQHLTWAQAGEAAPAAGNGAAIRAVPIGVSFKTQARRLGAADMQASITHHDKRARAAAQIVAEVSFLAATEDVDLTTWTKHLAELIERGDARLASSLRNLERVVDLPPNHALEHLIPACFQEEDGYPRPDRIRGFAAPTVLYALSVFFRAPDDMHRALEWGLGGGGDTASLGALLGAWLGGRAGLSNLTPRLKGWARLLHDHGHAKAMELADLGEALVTR